MATVVLQNNWQSLLESDQRFELASPRFQFYESIKVALKPSSCDSSPAKSDDNAFLEEIAFNSDEDSSSSFDADSKIGKEADESDSSGVDSAKHSSSSLSESSLRLCTESLGNESGSDFTAIGGFPSSDACPEFKNESQEELRHHLEESRKAKEKCGAVFPPPLTTISCGSEPLRVSAHRLDGRLVIEAAKASPRSIGFRSRRSRGHLQLCY